MESTGEELTRKQSEWNRLTTNESLISIGQAAFDQMVEADVAAEGEAWLNRVDDLSVTDQDSYDQMADLLKIGADREKAVEAAFEPATKVFHGLHSLFTSAKKLLAGPYQTGKQIAGRKMAAFQEEKRREHEREQRRLEEEARRKQEEEAARVAAEEKERLIAEGVSRREAEAKRREIERDLKSEPPPPVSAPPTLQKASGITTRKPVPEIKVVNLRELVRAVANGKASLGFLDPNISALNTHIRIPGNTAPPGTRVIMRAPKTYVSGK